MNQCPACGATATGSNFCTSCGSPMGEAQVQSQPMQAPPMAPQGPVGASASNTFSTLGIIFGAVAFLFFPILFGPAGIVLSAVGKSKGEKNANLALGISIGGMVLGFIIGAATADLYW